MSTKKSDPSLDLKPNLEEWLDHINESRPTHITFTTSLGYEGKEKVLHKKTVPFSDKKPPTNEVRKDGGLVIPIRGYRGDTLRILRKKLVEYGYIPKTISFQKFSNAWHGSGDKIEWLGRKNSLAAFIDSIPILEGRTYGKWPRLARIFSSNDYKIKNLQEDLKETKPVKAHRKRFESIWLMATNMDSQ